MPLDLLWAQDLPSSAFIAKADARQLMLTNLVHDRQQLLAFDVALPHFLLHPSASCTLRVSSIENLDDHVAPLDDLSQFPHECLRGGIPSQSRVDRIVERNAR